MSAITNFNPVQSVNSLLKPLGLTLSNKQQIINKLALATLAILAVTYGLEMVEGGSVWDISRSRTFAECQRMCEKIQVPDEGADCNRRCRNTLVELVAGCDRACQNRFSGYID